MQKKKRTDLQVPDWVAKEWNKGTKEREQMAQILQDVNWSKVGLCHLWLQRFLTRTSFCLGIVFQPFWRVNYTHSPRTTSWMRCSASSPLARGSALERIRVGIQSRRWKRIWNGPRIWDLKKHAQFRKNYPSLWLFTSLKILQCTAKSSCQGHELLLWRSTAWPKNENTTMWGFVTSSFPLFYFPFPKPYYHTSSCACQEEQVRWCCWVLGDDPRVWVLWGGAWSGGIQEIDFQGFPLCLIRVWNATMCLPKNHQLGDL